MNQQENNIYTVIRIRPKINNEKDSKKIVFKQDKQKIIFDPQNNENRFTFLQGIKTKQISINYRRCKHQEFTFDYIFDETSTQYEIFENLGIKMIDKVLEGYNATIFAYGATGCGKTYTISGTEDDPGLIPLLMHYLFNKIEKDNNEDYKFDLSLSYLEIYNEQIKDLIPNNKLNTKNLDLRETKNGINIPGLSEHRPHSVNDVMKLVIQGNLNRSVSETEANKNSSRSHAILQIKISQKPRCSGLTTIITNSILRIIDLAGSERANLVCNNDKNKLLEGANINRSLLALRNCITALSQIDDSKNINKIHIPYRDSRLTRLLKFSLQGNCLTTMIVCINSTYNSYEDILNSLMYAARTKNIKARSQSTKNTLNLKLHASDYDKVINDLNKEKKLLQQQIDYYNKNKNNLNDFKKINKMALIECSKKIDSEFEEIKNQKIEIFKLQLLEKLSDLNIIKELKNLSYFKNDQIIELLESILKKENFEKLNQYKTYLNQLLYTRNYYLDDLKNIDQINMNELNYNIIKNNLDLTDKTQDLQIKNIELQYLQNLNKETQDIITLLFEILDVMPIHTTEENKNFINQIINDFKSIYEIDDIDDTPTIDFTFDVNIKSSPKAKFYKPIIKNYNNNINYINQEEESLDSKKVVKKVRFDIEDMPSQKKINIEKTKQKTKPQTLKSIGLKNEKASRITPGIFNKTNGNGTNSFTPNVKSDNQLNSKLQIAKNLNITPKIGRISSSLLKVKSKSTKS